MEFYEPVTLAMPLAKNLMDFIRAHGELPEGDELREMLKGLGIEESCLNRGMAIYRTKFLVVLAFPREENVVIDVISSSGELSDALEVVAYHDRKLGAFIVEIIPANDLEYEGNIGIEPVIIDEKTLELESNPVLGYFEEDREGLFLVIERETYLKWRENGNNDTCPVCGGELAWKGEKAYCRDCGYGVKVVEK